MHGELLEDCVSHPYGYTRHNQGNLNLFSLNQNIRPLNNNNNNNSEGQFYRNGI